MAEAIDPISVRFPLLGEWCAVNTPGHKVPSHGTDQLGQRYAYDFFQIDWSEGKGYRFYKTSKISSLLFGVKLSDTFCWSKPIISPFDGEVVEAKDGVKERNPVHLVRDLAVTIKNGFTLRPKNNDDLGLALGNYIILKNDTGVYSLIAHAKYDSIGVSEGDKIIEGQELAEVGHSGNSTAPHLHFQRMDRSDLLNAVGLPCCFKYYKSYQSGSWESVTNGIPEKRERIKV